MTDKIVADRHWWATADGRYVETGHVDAETLAYPAGTELPDDVARQLGLLNPPPDGTTEGTEPATEPTPEPAPVDTTPKAARKPADKSRRRPAGDK